jgi:hypothetical protein
MRRLRETASTEEGLRRAMDLHTDREAVILYLDHPLRSRLN